MSFFYEASFHVAVYLGLCWKIVHWCCLSGVGNDSRGVDGARSDGGRSGVDGGSGRGHVMQWQR